MSNGTYNDSQLAHYSEMGIYSAEKESDIVTSAAKLISECFAGYCEVSVMVILGRLLISLTFKMGSRPGMFVPRSHYLMQLRVT